MVIDPILRFNWVFYARYPVELQQSALLSFFVNFSEILRRGIWTVLRVENEHCTNVGRFRASRDVPLPYSVPSTLQETVEDGAMEASQAPIASTTSLHAHSSPELESATGQSVQTREGGIRRRRTMANLPDTPITRGLARVGSAVASAHAQDYERKKKVTVSSLASKAGYHDGSGGSSDEDDDDLASHVSQGNMTTEGSLRQHRTHETG